MQTQGRSNALSLQLLQGASPSQPAQLQSWHCIFFKPQTAGETTTGDAELAVVEFGRNNNKSQHQEQQQVAAQQLQQLGQQQTA
jgi:hypothetical protein